MYKAMCILAVVKIKLCNKTLFWYRITAICFVNEPYFGRVILIATGLTDSTGYGK
jgi:hypothetical protein